MAQRSILQDLNIEFPEQPIDVRNENVENEKRPVFRVEKIMITKSKPTVIIPDLKKFSRYLRLKRVVAWCWRAVNIMLRKNKFSGELTASELEHAEELLCRNVQKEAFRSEYASLKAKMQLSSDSQLYNLTPYMDENDLIRVQGRIDAAT